MSHLQNRDGSFSTDVAPVQPSSTPGLWELHSFTIGDDGQGHAHGLLAASSLMDKMSSSWIITVVPFRRSKTR